LTERPPLLSLSVAMDLERVIGRDNQLPWHLPDELKRFRAITMGKAIVMGVRTFESIGKPLPGRHSIVLTRDRARRIEGVEIAHTLDEAMRLGGQRSAEVVVIGGAMVFRESLPLCERLYLSVIEARVGGDAHFPPMSGRWRLVERGYHPVDAKHALAYHQLVLQRAQASAESPEDFDPEAFLTSLGGAPQERAAGA
jgi:dihydrofolate reductase